MADARAIDCRTCLAGPDAHCIAADGTPTPYIHATRRRRARYLALAAERRAERDPRDYPYDAMGDYS
jgi:hypothetical protein